MILIYMDYKDYKLVGVMYVIYVNIAFILLV